MQPRSREFARGIAFYGKDLALWLLRGPGTPHARLRHARTRLEQALVAEIERRRREHRTADDIVSMLMRAEDEDGWHFSNRQLVDHLLTLLFAGHDTTSITVALLLFELARHPNWRSKVVAELDQAVAAGLPGEEQLFG